MIAAYRLLVARLNELDDEDARKGRGGLPEPPGRLGSIAPTYLMRQFVFWHAQDKSARGPAHSKTLRGNRTRE